VAAKEGGWVQNNSSIQYRWAEKKGSWMVRTSQKREARCLLPGQPLNMNEVAKPRSQERRDMPEREDCKSLERGKVGGQLAFWKTAPKIREKREPIFGGRNW